MNRRVFAFIALLAAAASCSSPKRYEMRGQILGINRDRLEVLVKHDEIPGLMAAMTMPWKVRSVSLLDNLGPGDLITSQLEVDDNQGVIIAITKIGTAKPDLPAPAAPAKPGVKYLGPGDSVPDQVLVDHDGRKRTFTDIRRGRALAVTFIYTKCPIPTFCPAMDRQFAEAQTLLKQKELASDAGLLSVSFDPKNDTPAVLKSHAQKLGYDPKVWTFVTADEAAIDAFSTSFGVTLARGQAANPDEIGHTLRTSLVDREGRIVKSYSGADWTPAEIVRELEQLR